LNTSEQSEPSNTKNDVDKNYSICSKVLEYSEQILSDKDMAILHFGIMMKCLVITLSSTISNRIKIMISPNPKGNALIKQDSEFVCL